MEIRHTDVAVVGSGITGLLTARSALRLGYSATIIETSDKVSSGATVRNEGWLHYGTYHAVSIRPRSTAIDVAKGCIAGSTLLQQIAPEAVDNPYGMAYSFTRDKSRILDIEDRWREAGVKFSSIPMRELAQAIPELLTTDIEMAYRVSDQAVNTSVLVRILKAECERLGAQILLRSRVASYPAPTITLHHDHSGAESSQLDARYIFVTSGAGTKIVAETLGKTLPGQLRLWQSNLILARKFISEMFISLDPGDITSVNHGNCTVIGLNDDAYLISGQHEVEAGAQNGTAITKSARNRLTVPLADNFTISSCIKVDFSVSDDQPRSLSPELIPLASNIVVLLPGKMSEAPLVAHRAVTDASAYLGCSDTSIRSYENIVGSEAWMRLGVAGGERSSD